MLPIPLVVMEILTHDSRVSGAVTKSANLTLGHKDLGKLR